MYRLSRTSLPHCRPPTSTLRQAFSKTWGSIPDKIRTCNLRLRSTRGNAQVPEDHSLTISKFYRNRRFREGFGADLVQPVAGCPIAARMLQGPHPRSSLYVGHRVAKGLASNLSRNAFIRLSLQSTSFRQFKPSMRRLVCGFTHPFCALRCASFNSRPYQPVGPTGCRL
jgi:hypothetical protein